MNYTTKLILKGLIYLFKVYFMSITMDNASDEFKKEGVELLNKLKKELIIYETSN